MHRFTILYHLLKIFEMIDKTQPKKCNDFQSPLQILYYFINWFYDSMQKL